MPSSTKAPFWRMSKLLPSLHGQKNKIKAIGADGTTMTATRKEFFATFRGLRVTSPEPPTYDYYEELSDSDHEKIRKHANAPAKDDADWTVVDGPGW